MGIVKIAAFRVLIFELIRYTICSAEQKPAQIERKIRQELYFAVKTKIEKF